MWGGEGSKGVVAVVGVKTLFDVVHLGHVFGVRAWPQKLDHKLRCIMEQVTKPVEGQYEGQETAAALGSTPVAEQSRAHPSGCASLFPSRGPNIGTHLSSQVVRSQIFYGQAHLKAEWQWWSLESFPAAWRKRIESSRLVFGEQELLEFSPQVLSASPRSARADQPPEDQDGRDQRYEFGVFQEFREVEHDGGTCRVGELDCITCWFGLVLS